MKKALRAAGIAGLLSVGANVRAGDRVEVRLERPAISDWELGTIVIAPPQGECGDGIGERIKLALDKHKVTAGLVDLRKVIYERKTKLPTFLGAAEVKSLGKQIEADTLFLVRVTKCTYPERSYWSGHPKNFLGLEDKGQYEYRTTTRMSISGTLQLLDLKGGRISKPITLQTAPEVTYKHKTRYPDEPSTDAFREEAMGNIVTQIEILFFPWTETRELVFYDDKDCNLKAAQAAMKSGNFKGALELSQKNNEECKANPKAKDKHKVRAAHNVGAALLATNDYAGALPLFQEALRLGGGDDQKAAIDFCQGQIDLKETVGQVEAKVAAAALAGTPGY